jgi:hypothetical protein
MTEATESIFAGSFLEKLMADIAATTEPIGPKEPVDELMEEVVVTVTNPYLQRAISVFMAALGRQTNAIARLKRAGARADKALVDEVVAASQYALGVQQVLFIEIHRRHPELVGAKGISLRQGFKITLPIQRLVVPANMGQVMEFGRPVYVPDIPEPAAEEVMV